MFLYYMRRISASIVKKISTALCGGFVQNCTHVVCSRTVSSVKQLKLSFFVTIKISFLPIFSYMFDCKNARYCYPISQWQAWCVLMKTNLHISPEKVIGYDLVKVYNAAKIQRHAFMLLFYSFVVYVILHILLSWLAESRRCHITIFDVISDLDA